MFWTGFIAGLVVGVVGIILFVMAISSTDNDEDIEYFFDKEN